MRVKDAHLFEQRGVCSFCGHTQKAVLRDAPNPIVWRPCTYCARNPFLLHCTALWVDSIHLMGDEEAYDLISRSMSINEIEPLFRFEARNTERHHIMRALYEQMLVIRIDGDWVSFKVGRGSRDYMLSLPEWHAEVRREESLPVSEAEGGWNIEDHKLHLEAGAESLSRLQEGVKYAIRP